MHECMHAQIHVYSIHLLQAGLDAGDGLIIFLTLSCSAERNAKGTSSKGNRLRFHNVVNLVDATLKYPKMTVLQGHRVIVHVKLMFARNSFQPQIDQTKVRPFQLTLLDMKVAGEML